VVCNLPYPGFVWWKRFKWSLSFFGDHMCPCAARGWLSIVIIIHVHFDTFK
jgi:hypothetical protein